MSDEVYISRGYFTGTIPPQLMAICDPVILRRELETDRLCREIIARYQELPWWRKNFEPDPRALVRQEWQAYREWMHERLRAESARRRVELQRWVEGVE